MVVTSEISGVVSFDRFRTRDPRLVDRGAQLEQGDAEEQDQDQEGGGREQPSDIT